MPYTREQAINDYEAEIAALERRLANANPNSPSRGLMLRWLAEWQQGLEQLKALPPGADAEKFNY